MRCAANLKLTTGGSEQYLFLSTHSFITGRSLFSNVLTTVPFSAITFKDHWLKKEIKFINLNEGVRWVCQDCKALVGWPTQHDLKKWSK